MALPEANAGGANFPTASQLSARLVKASSEARQIERFQAHPATDIRSPRTESMARLVEHALDVDVYLRVDAEVDWYELQRAFALVLRRLDVDAIVKGRFRRRFY